MTLDDLRNLDPKKIGSWPVLPKFGALLLALLLILGASYWFDWQHQIEQIESEKQKEEKERRKTFDDVETKRRWWEAKDGQPDDPALSRD